MGRRPKNPLAGLARAANDQIKRAELLGKSLDERIKMKREAASNWVPNEDDRRDFLSITQTLQHAGNAMSRAMEDNKKNLGGLTEEQLQAQLRAELVAIVQTLSDDEWNMLVEARMKGRR